ncbi:motility associated factor glycosyltransferase family protein [Paenibacillus graminis]|uniref:motility associated factor glycosyltransferase family protein n=1 Tax=Paenibacillus graminis TaxID=189425 RepID=UPI00046F6E94|nr:6-hydroxymethylpterin diphosphokinase MptE-like protein [Paenibacillus graminis]
MSYFQQNQAVLRLRFPHVADKVSNIEEQDIELIKYFEPVEKDENWLEAVRGSVGDLNIILLYGFGQGISIADLVEMYPDRLLFVYEPNEENFHDSLKTMDLTLILEHPNLYFLAVGKSQLIALFHSLSTHMRKDMAFVALRHYLEHTADSLQDIKKKFEEYSETFDSNKLTRNLFRRDWIRNSMYHMAGMLSSPSIKEFYKEYENATAVIIASGPSLQADIEWVKRIKPHALIISAGSSIQALVKNGIAPHLATLLDGGVINNKVFADPAALKAPFLFVSSSYYGISDKKDKHKIHAIVKNDEVAQYYMGIEADEAEIIPTSTVTGTAIQAAVWLGVKRIVMMGQDLSFPNKKYYADGVGHSELNILNAMVENSDHKLLSVQGNYNATSSAFMSMKDGLEKLISSFPDIEFINSTRNGAVIEGTLWKPIEQVYELLAEEIIDQRAIENLIDKKEFAEYNEALEKVENRISSTVRDFSEIIKDFKILKKLFSDIRELSRTNPLKCQRKIVKIEQVWGGIVNRPWFEALIETLLPIELQEYDRELPSIILEKNLVRKCNLIDKYLGTLVNQIESEIPFLEEVFIESLRRIEALSDKVQGGR